MKCPNCNRELVTKKQITKNGCNWCDTEWHRKVIDLKKFLNELKGGE